MSADEEQASTNNDMSVISEVHSYIVQSCSKNEKPIVKATSM